VDIILLYIILHCLLQLFYLVASSYQANCKTVEMLKHRGRDIYWTFFTENAPLQLHVDEAITSRISKYMQCYTYVDIM